MNIFILDYCPLLSAKQLFSLDPIRARKQIVELCQMLAQSHNCIPKTDGTYYKQNKSIANHPATKWVNASKSNKEWSIKYLKCLLLVYSHLNGKEHGCLRAYQTIRLKEPCNMGDANKLVTFGWHSKKVAQLELSSNVFEAHKLYIQAKQRGLYKN